MKNSKCSKPEQESGHKMPQRFMRERERAYICLELVIRQGKSFPRISFVN